ncbi:hypothetical protein BsWGS_25921 [Bradybaena similaris]
MATTRLSQREDLLQGIHADGVLGYLQRHGVLDTSVLAGLGEKATRRQINATILRQVERQGRAALTLLVNALRQSWQLQLANSLDPDHKIQPTSGTSYFGNHRHKGELTIQIQIEALKIITQENKQEVRAADENKRQDFMPADRDFTQNVSHLHEKIIYDLAVSPDLNRSRPDEADGIAFKVEDDEDFVKPKSCWCFCLFRKKKSKTKKNLVKQKTSESYKVDKKPTPDVNPVLPQHVAERKVRQKNHRKKLKSKSKSKNYDTESTLNKNLDNREGSKSKEKYSNRKFISSKSDISEKYLVSENTNGLYRNQLTDLRSPSQVDINFGRDEIADVKVVHGSGGDMFSTDHLDSSLGIQDSRRHNAEHFHNLLHQPYIQTKTDLKIKSTSQIARKETQDSEHTSYKHRLDLATVKVNNNNLIIPTRQTGNTYITCQDLTSADRDFERIASELCVKMTHEHRNDIIKYFEQEQGILVLDVAARNIAVDVVCICMTRQHVKSFQYDLQSGGLLRKIENMFGKVDTAICEIQEVQLKIGVDDKEMRTVLAELSWGVSG